MKVTKEQCKLIMDMTKTNFAYTNVEIFWADKSKLTHDDLILKSYCKSISSVLDLDIEFDLGTEVEFSDVTHQE